MMTYWRIYANVLAGGKAHLRLISERVTEKEAEALAREYAKIHSDWVMYIVHPKEGSRFISANS